MNLHLIYKTNLIQFVPPTFVFSAVSQKSQMNSLKNKKNTLRICY